MRFGFRKLRDNSAEYRTVAEEAAGHYAAKPLRNVSDLNAQFSRLRGAVSPLSARDAPT